MIKLVICPELRRPARIDAASLHRNGREQVLYCTLWESERVIEGCRETCMLGARRKPPKPPR
jgi:hypothetical protein